MASWQFGVVRTEGNWVLEKVKSALEAKWNAAVCWLSYSGDKKCLYCDDVFTAVVNCPLRAMFCHYECYLVFEREKLRQSKNPWLCLVPGCDGVRAHKNQQEWFDYCGRRHAQAHEVELRKVYYQQQNTHHYHDTYYRGINGPIRFYSKDEPYYEFTNFANFPIIVDGCFYNTSEHYFQAQKLVGTPYVDYVALLPRPRDAFEFPRQPHIAYWVRKDWQFVKESVMYKGLYHKFTQYSDLKKLLLETGNRNLIEDSPHDSYWGIGRDGKGLNRLGHLLIKLRSALRNQRVSTDGNQSSTHYEPLCTQMNSNSYDDSAADTKTQTDNTNQLNTDSPQRKPSYVAGNPNFETATQPKTQSGKNSNPRNLHSSIPQVVELSQEKSTNENPQVVNPVPENVNAVKTPKLHSEAQNNDPQDKNLTTSGAENQQCGFSKPIISQPETDSGNLTFENPTQSGDTTSDVPATPSVPAVNDSNKLSTVGLPTNVSAKDPSAKKDPFINVSPIGSTPLTEGEHIDLGDLHSSSHDKHDDSEHSYESDDVSDMEH